MDERIKELYNQCIVYNTHPEAIGDGPADIVGFNTNKFAELIITECASVAYKSCDQGDIAAQSILYEFNIDNARQQK